jgi:hypothetical protein
MPSKSKAQHNLMAAVAHNAAFAKKVGIPQSVGKDFNAADKGRKFSKGGDMATKKMAKGGASEAKMGAVKTAAPSKDGLAERGKTRALMPKMAGSTTGMKKGGKVRK